MIRLQVHHGIFLSSKITTSPHPGHTSDRASKCSRCTFTRPTIFWEIITAARDGPRILLGTITAAGGGPRIIRTTTTRPHSQFYSYKQVNLYSAFTLKPRLKTYFFAVCPGLDPLFSRGIQIVLLVTEP